MNKIDIRWIEMLEKQYEFTSAFDPLTFKGKEEFFKEKRVLVVEECIEILQECDRRKTHKMNFKEPDIQKINFEIVDTFKYLINIYINSLGIERKGVVSMEEFHKEFLRTNGVKSIEELFKKSLFEFRNKFPVPSANDSIRETTTIRIADEIVQNLYIHSSKDEKALNETLKRVIHAWLIWNTRWGIVDKEGKVSFKAGDDGNIIEVFKNSKGEYGAEINLAIESFCDYNDKKVIKNFNKQFNNF